MGCCITFGFDSSRQQEIAGLCEFFLLFSPAITSFLLVQSGGGVDWEDFYIKQITVVRASLSDPNLFVFKKTVSLG